MPVPLSSYPYPPALTHTQIIPLPIQIPVPLSSTHLSHTYLHPQFTYPYPYPHTLILHPPLTHTQESMDLPNDKRQVVMGSSEEKKWQMVRDFTRRRRQVPPHEYLNKLRQVTEGDPSRRMRRKIVMSSTVQNLQGLEISLRTNNIRWVVGD